MIKTYKWDKKEILLEYLKCLKGILNICNKSKIEYLYDKDYLEDMLHVIFKFSYTYPKFFRYINLKKDLNSDEYFSNNVLTKFQNDKINEIIKTTVKNDFFYIYKCEEFNNSETDILTIKNFLKELNLLLYDEFNITINNNKLYIDDSDKEYLYAGSCFSLKDKNYYHVICNNYNNLFLSINHENVHGLINRLSNRKFDKNKTLRLYREVGSILVEMYGNEYLYKNQLINEEQYIYNYNSIYLINMYDQIEVIDFLYRLSKMSFRKDFINIKKMIKQEMKVKPNYDFKLTELNELPLEHYLIYLYSSAIAISLFNMYKDEPKKGIDAAIDIMLNINENNEKEIFEKYNIGFEKALNDYKKNNNYLIKKRNN